MTAAPTVSLPLLQRIQIAAPCNERWEDMTGDERTRHCASCRLDVYNIAGMTEADAESLLRSAFNDDGSSKGRGLCARIYRRADGTIITADCPVGLAALRAKARRGAVRVAAALGITTVIGWVAAMEQGPGAWAGCQPFSAVASALGRQPAAMLSSGAVAGGVRFNPGPATPAPAPQAPPNPYAGNTLEAKR